MIPQIKKQTQEASRNIPRWQKQAMGVLASMLLLSAALAGGQAYAQRGEPAYVDACLEEPSKEAPDMASVEEECRLAGKYYKKNHSYGNASWVYLLNGQWDEAMSLSDDGEPVSGMSVLFMNQGHIAAMRGDMDKAKSLYEKHIAYNTRPVGEGFEDDMDNILPKLFPEYLDEIEQAQEIWLKLYEPIAKIDALYSDYSDALTDRDFKALSTILEEVQGIKSDENLDTTIGFFHSQAELSYIAELQGEFTEAEKLNKAIINNINDFDVDAATTDWILRETYLNLGRIALRNRDYSLALEHFGQGNEHALSQAYYNADARLQWSIPFSEAATLSAMGRRDEAMTKLLETIDQIEVELESKAEQVEQAARFVQALANLQAREGDIEQATTTLEDLLDALTEYGEVDTLIDAFAITYHDLARVYALEGSYKKSAQNYELAIDLSANAMGEYSRQTQRFVVHYIQLLKIMGDNEKISELLDYYAIDPDTIINLETIL